MRKKLGMPSGEKPKNYFSPGVHIGGPQILGQFYVYLGGLYGFGQYKGDIHTLFVAILLEMKFCEKTTKNSKISPGVHIGGPQSLDKF